MVEGLTLSLMGITVTFTALSFLVLIIVVLERLFRGRSSTPDKQEREERAVDSTLARNTSEEEVVAAIAVALAHLHSLDIGQSGLGTTLESGRGSWWVMGRMQQHLLDAAQGRRGRRQG